ncbi:hypothetical protein [Paenibacillus dendritiformis]|uniref:hypothetical protein n=1 Tax=Paenibacillus dendritiformis TaxID=130049 RepID=UPI00387E02D8
MNREVIVEIIEETAKEYGWSLEQAMEGLEKIGFTVDKVEGNLKFNSSHVKLSVDFAYMASWGLK